MNLQEKEAWLSSKDHRWKWLLEKLQAARDQPPLGRTTLSGWAGNARNRTPMKRLSKRCIKFSCESMASRQHDPLAEAGGGPASEPPGAHSGHSEGAGRLRRRRAPDQPAS